MQRFVKTGLNGMKGFISSPSGIWHRRKDGGMYYQVASKTVVTTTDGFTQAVSLAGANAVYVGVQAIARSSTGTLTVTVQTGNDLENWSNVTGATAVMNAIGYGTILGTALAAQYARLKLSNDNGTFIIAADVNSAQL